MAADRSMRSVFVGNIPYEATEDKLKDIFSEVGPVLSFRLVFDRETGKPKGYGFCEYQDQETALSAMRNLNGYELNGRQLRVDNAASEKNKEMDTGTVTVLPESPFGEAVTPAEAPEAISKAVESLPPEQMFELMKQMKTVIQNNPVEARNMLLQNPQLAYALLQAQVVMRIVNPEIAMTLLHKQNDPTPPLQPAAPIPAGNPPRGGPVSLGGPHGIPRLNVPMPGAPMPGPPMTIPNQMPSQQQLLRGGLLGDGPRGPPAQERAPDRGGMMDRGMEPRDMEPRGIEPRGMEPRGMEPRGMEPRGMEPRGMEARGMGPRGSDRPIDHHGSTDNRGLPMDRRGPGFDRGFDRAPESRVHDPRAPHDFNRQMGAHSIGPSGGQGGGHHPGGPQHNVHHGQSPLQMPSGLPQPGPQRGQPNPTAQEQEKAALIMQVLQLSNEQINMLPSEQRQSIMVLKEQIARSQGQLP
ncbi:cleavage stimulation factor subunit 2-like [Anneissia japonica]|uniref:cleavage stimulation factor subunit 2-like n=1 Tax=Anneissia japonica TaxID=1529436 RepID=UPI001425B872|nr:cleavage stimulation factor subunit 2-like [Anneissia japonica]